MRNGCPNHHAESGRFAPVERICDRGADGKVGGLPLALHREAGSWERVSIAGLRRALPFDGMAA